MGRAGRTSVFAASSNGCGGPDGADAVSQALQAPTWQNTHVLDGDVEAAVRSNAMRQNDCRLPHRGLNAEALKELEHTPAIPWEQVKRELGL